MSLPNLRGPDMIKTVAEALAAYDALQVRRDALSERYDEVTDWADYRELDEISRDLHEEATDVLDVLVAAIRTKA
jgi:hypothetical protein